MSEGKTLEVLLQRLAGHVGRQGHLGYAALDQEIPEFAAHSVLVSQLAPATSELARLQACVLPAVVVECDGAISVPLTDSDWRLDYFPERLAEDSPLAEWLLEVGDVRPWLKPQAKKAAQAVKVGLDRKTPGQATYDQAEALRQRRVKRLEGWLANIEDEFRGLRSSMRWRLGHRLISLVERLMLRRSVPLATDRIANILAAFRRSQREAFLSDAQSAGYAAPLTSGERVGKAIANRESVLGGGSVFVRACSELIARDTVVGERLRSLLETGEQSLAGALRDLSELDGPLVSIVMPTWQRAEIIGQAIASVMEQSYPHWELLVCDDGSTDDTEQRVMAVKDDRVRYLKLPHEGAAAARNSGLRESKGELIAYLDSDNLWHPDYLNRIVLAFLENPGSMAVVTAWLDVEQTATGLRLRERDIEYSYEALQQKNFIDLNVFSHRRSLYDCFGGFTAELPRRQDWDFVLKLLFRFDPLVIDTALCLYRRNSAWGQLTRLAEDKTAQATALIERNLERYYNSGCLIPSFRPRPRKVTVLVWDVCRNHFSKAWNIAEALSADYEVQLLGFRFFEEPIFPPYKDAQASFDTCFIDGSDFPEFEAAVGQALMAIDGDIVYCVKPRLPSFGLGLLANYHFGVPVICESNDMESGVSRPGEASVDIRPPDASDADFLTPYHDRWTAWMEGLLRRWPWKVTHNSVHDRWLGGGCFRMMNIKDERVFKPDCALRDGQRKALGISADEFVILFGGLVRRHKGIFELLEFVQQRVADGERLRLLVVGSRASPEFVELRKQGGASVSVLDPQDRNAMASINAAADAVLLWLNPQVDAAHHQMPFKMTDAFAMEVPVLASPVGDLHDLANRDVVVPVGFNDTQTLQKAIGRLRTDEAYRKALTGRARQYYLRQFTYQAAREQFSVMERNIGFAQKSHPVAVEFARQFSSLSKAFEHPEGDQLGRAE